MCSRTTQSPWISTRGPSSSASVHECVCVCVGGGGGGGGGRLVTRRATSQAEMHTCSFPTPPPFSSFSKGLAVMCPEFSKQWLFLILNINSTYKFASFKLGLRGKLFFVYVYMWLVPTDQCGHIPKGGTISDSFCWPGSVLLCLLTSHLLLSSLWVYAVTCSGGVKYGKEHLSKICITNRSFITNDISDPLTDTMH